MRAPYINQLPRRYAMVEDCLTNFANTGRGKLRAIMSPQTTDDPRRAKMLKRKVQLSFVVCAAFLALATAQAHACKSATHCVAGAEVDTPATLKARARVGTGPDAGLASDRRLKTDVTLVDKLKNGIKVYSFKFIWDDTVRVGFIAQELLDREDTRGAVLTLSNGLLGVDYTALGLRVATLDQWQKYGQASLRAEWKPPTLAHLKQVPPVTLYNRRTARN